VSSYTTVDKVKAKFLELEITSITAVKTETVENEILIQSARIDGRLRSRYEVPITGTDALRIVENICTLFVASAVDVILRRGRAEADDDYMGLPKDLREQADKDLNALIMGGMILSDAVPIGSGSEVSSYNVANNIQPHMRKDVRKW
jgi:phage gp36-like protein